MLMIHPEFVALQAVALARVQIADNGRVHALVFGEMSRQVARVEEHSFGDL